MTRLILTTGMIPYGPESVDGTGVVLPFRHYFDDLQRLVYGHPPAAHEIDDYVAPWSEQRHQASGSLARFCQFEVPRPVRSARLGIGRTLHVL